MDGAMSTAPKPPRRRHFDCPEQEVYLNLWRTYDRLRALEDELFAAHDLTAQQYNTLRLLRAEHPGSLPTMTLAAGLISRAPDITRLINRLELRGLVRREHRPDNRRVVQVAITDAGIELLRELARPVRECARRQLGHLDDAQQRQLIELLRAARAPHDDPSGQW
jgi:DNA-binding MarR family transcriptional regulator